MREIKFRAWVHDDKDITEGWMTFQVCVMLNGECYLDGDICDIDDCVKIMQYTGLKDKNGKPIYEGDIVKAHRFYDAVGQNMGVYEAEIEEVCEVKYICDNAAFGLSPVESEDEGYIEPLNCSDDGIEIIGNIYENPELIKEELNEK